MTTFYTYLQLTPTRHLRLVFRWVLGQPVWRGVVSKPPSVLWEVAYALRRSPGEWSIFNFDHRCPCVL